MAYATREDLESLGIGAGALSGLDDDIIEAALEAASRLADGYLAARYTLPLRAWGADLRRAVAIIAAYDVLAVRGFSPTGPDEHIRLRMEDAIRWLELVARGTISPAAVTDSAPERLEEGAVIYTSTRRWP